MTNTATPEGTPQDQAPESAHVARVRLALAQATYDLASSARALALRPDEYNAVSRANQLTHRVRQIIELAVRYEIQRGATWDQIGGTLGISRQAAHQRFGALAKNAHFYEGFSSHSNPWESGDLMT